MISKNQIQEAYIDLMEKKISDVRSELEEVRKSANAETKSSMGDKYETSREMMMQEQNRLGSQLDIFSDQLGALRSVDLDKNHSAVSYGCLVETDKVNFFLCAAIGQLIVEKTTVFAISGEAPIAKSMHGKKKGETFIFNNVTYSIKGIS